MNKNQNVIKERDARTQAVLDRLKKLKPDEVVSYHELSRLIKGDPQGELRWCLQSAMKAARREFRIVVEAVPTVGLRRHTDRSNAELAWRRRRKVRRAARRAGDKLDCINLGQLTAKEVEAVTKERFVLHLIEDQASPAAVKVAEPGAVDRRPGLPPGIGGV